MIDRILAEGHSFVPGLELVRGWPNAVGSIRWAKRHPMGAELLASAMILVLGMAGPVVHPPQQGIEEAREDKGKKGAESGDPPDS